MGDDYVSFSQLLSTKYHKQGSFYRSNVLSILEIRNSESGDQQGHTPTKTCKRKSTLSSLSFLHFLAILGISWLEAVSLTPLSQRKDIGLCMCLYSLSPHRLFLVCLCPNFTFLFFFNYTSHIGLRTHLTPE